jgi:hypothetical protein
MKIFSNLSGTTKDVFSIGKHRGVQFIRGHGHPNDEDFDDSPLGSLYFQTETGLVYTRQDDGWHRVKTEANKQVITSMIMWGTIENCVRMVLIVSVILVSIVAILFKIY